MARTGEPLSKIGKAEKRLQAVLSVLGGERVADVAARFAIPRSDLYKFRRRALEAMRSALEDRPRAPRHPHNRLEPSREVTVAEVCGRSPTVSSYQIHERLGKCARRDSNSQPSDPKSDALSIELRARGPKPVAS
jgi:hypothetical protein